MEKKVFLLVLFCIIFILGIGSVKAGCVSNNEDYICGDTVYESCTMNCDLSCSGNGFIIGADNIILDGNGYSLFHEGPSPGSGIIIGGYDNITIKNYNITNFSSGAGIALGYSSNNNIINNIGKLNRNGISLSTSANNNNIINNTFTSNSRYGIKLTNAQYNIIENNNFSQSRSRSAIIEGIGGAHNSFTNCSLLSYDFFPLTMGIWMSMDANNNSFNNCDISGYSRGVFITGEANNNSFINCDIYGHGPGVVISQYANDNSFDNCNFYSDGSYGTHITYNCDNNSFNNCNFYDCGVVLSYESNGNSFNNCEISGAYRGIYLLESKQNKIINSIIIDSSIDIYSEGMVSDNTFLNVSFNKSNTDIVSGKINVKWYMDVFVNLRGLFNPPNAIVNAYDVNNNLYFSEETDSRGYLTRQNVTEYYETNAGKTYLTEYSVNATKDGYDSQWTEYVNLTTNFIDKNRIVLKIRRDPN